jgi:hypothetical protein
MRAATLWPGGLHVDALRLHAHGDRLRARQRVEAALGAVDVAACGVAAHELLIVRRIASAPSPVAGAALPRGVEAALRAAAQRARRPWLHADAAGAQAVVFADEAELIACLVRDWLRGVVLDRWWWRHLLRRHDPQQWIDRHVLHRGELLAAALAVAARERLAEPWIGRLTDVQARNAVAAIARSFRLAIEDEDAKTAGAARAVVAPSAPDPSPAARATALAQLQRIVPELRVMCGTAPQRTLLAVALAVHRDPVWVRTAQLRRALRLIEPPAMSGSLTAGALPRTAGVAGSGPRSTTAAALPRRADMITAAAARSAGAASARHRPRRGGAGVASRAASREVESTASPAQRARPSAASPGATHPTAKPLHDGAGYPTHVSLPAAPPPAAQSTPTTPWATDAAVDVSRHVHTAFGGIFYLANAALALELYGDFSAPRARSIHIAPWDLLALLGRHWCGDAFTRDPLWPLLSELGGRNAPVEPRLTPHAPPEWRVPLLWLDVWPDTRVLHVHATHTHLRLLHPAGFDVCDVRRVAGMSPLTQARLLCDELYASADFTLRRVSRAAPHARSQRYRWIEWLAGYLEARLAAALVMMDASAAVRLVCCHEADIHVTLMAVHVYLQLAALPLSIRVAGLDRDPGWIPAAGRTLSFHFT